jgi:hypothetical protein
MVGKSADMMVVYLADQSVVMRAEKKDKHLVE